MQNSLYLSLIKKSGLILVQFMVLCPDQYQRFKLILNSIKKNQENFNH